MNDLTFAIFDKGDYIPLSLYKKGCFGFRQELYFSFPTGYLRNQLITFSLKSKVMVGCQFIFSNIGTINSRVNFCNRFISRYTRVMFSNGFCSSLHGIGLSQEDYAGHNNRSTRLK
jgi:hypothetical protein